MTISYRACVPLLSIATLVATALPVAAAVADAPDAVDRILEQIETHTRRISSFSANFKQISLERAFNETDQSSGRLVVLKKRGGDAAAMPVCLVRFDYVTPERSVTIMNESRVLVWQQGLQVQEQPLVDDLKLRAMLAGVTSFADMQEHFVITVGTQTRTRVVLQFTPMSDTARRTFRTLQLTFDRQTWAPVVVVQERLNGDRVTLRFENIVLNRLVPEDIFTRAHLERLATGAAPKMPVKKPAAPQTRAGG
jgi:outer membrane lipoprotein-sorting protein